MYGVRQTFPPNMWAKDGFRSLLARNGMHDLANWRKAACAEAGFQFWATSRALIGRIWS